MKNICEHDRQWGNIHAGCELESLIKRLGLIQARRHGGGGGGGPPYYFFCLLAQRSVMSMMIIPLAHYDNIWKTFWSRKKGVGVSPPPPPPPPRSSAFSGLERLSRLAAAVARHFAPPPPPPPKQTPWRRPGLIHSLSQDISSNNERFANSFTVDPSCFNKNPCAGNWILLSRIVFKRDSLKR